MKNGKETMNKLKLPFGWDLHVVVCPEEELNDKTKRLGLTSKFNEEDKIQGTAEFIYKKSPKVSFFFIWVSDERPEYKYFLLHEIHHIVCIYCNHLGIVDEEFKAYLFEDICKQLKMFPEKEKKQ